MKLLTTVMLFLLLPFGCYAFEPTFPCGNVVGTIGASYTEAKSGELSPLAGGSLNNGLFYDLNDALTVEGFTVKTAAHGGAYSYDLAGWDGAVTQMTKLLAVTPLWPDRVNVVDISLFNDCLHSMPCSYSDMDTTMQNIYAAAEMANAAGKYVIIHAYPNWESLHLAEAVAFYGIDYSISESDYRVLQQKQIDKFSNVPWISFIYPWENAGVFDDGLHPNKKDMERAAHIIEKKIEELTK